jgi:hypothetical protein
LKPQIPSSQSSKGRQASKQAGRQAGKKSVSSETAKEKWIWVKFRKLKNTQPTKKEKGRKNKQTPKI